MPVSYSGGCILDREASCSDWDISHFYSVPSGKCWHTSTKYIARQPVSICLCFEMFIAQSHSLFSKLCTYVCSSESVVHPSLTLVFWFELLSRMGSFKFVLPKCTCLVGVQNRATCREIKTVRCPEVKVQENQTEPFQYLVSLTDRWNTLCASFRWLQHLHVVAMDRQHLSFPSLAAFWVTDRHSACLCLPYIWQRGVHTKQAQGNNPLIAWIKIITCSIVRFGVLTAALRKIAAFWNDALQSRI